MGTAKEILEGSRVTQWWDHYDPRQFMHAFHLVLASGQRVTIRVASDHVEQKLCTPDAFQGIVWQRLLNDRLRKPIVRGIKIQGKTVVLAIVGNLIMTVPEEELFEDATLASLVLLGASRNADARRPS